jgi:hypothetical protein
MEAVGRAVGAVVVAAAAAAAEVVEQSTKAPV